MSLRASVRRPRAGITGRSSSSVALPLPLPAYPAAGLLDVESIEPFVCGVRNGKGLFCVFVVAFEGPLAANGTSTAVFHRRIARYFKKDCR